MPQRYLTCCFLLIATIGNTRLSAQAVQWMHQGGLSGEGRGIATDADDNTYVAGTVGNPALFDNDTTTSHFADAFLAKYDADGGIQWVRTGGNELIDQANDVVTDADGNSYITGFFRTNGVFPTVSFDGTVLQGAGSSDLFVAKYATDGTLQWIRTGGGTLAEEGRGVAIATDGNVVVSGFFQGTAMFGDDTLHSAGLSDMLLLKYDTDGNLLWSMRAGGGGDDMANKLTALSNGDVAVVGDFQSAAIFGNTTIVSTGLSNFFVARFDANGAVQWAKGAGSTLNFAGDHAFAIAHDADDALVLCGEIAGPADIGGIALSTNGGADLFIARCTSTGDAVWAHHAGGDEADHAYGVALDAEGNAFMTGQVADGANTTFDTITLAPFGNEAVFFAKYDAAGAVQYVKRYAAGLGRAVAITAADCSYFTGAASGTVGQPAFDDVPWQYVDRAIFTARFCNSSVTAVNEHEQADASLMLAPDPVMDHADVLGVASNASIMVYNAEGALVQKGFVRDGLAVSTWPQGPYVLRALNVDGTAHTVRFEVVH